MSNINIIYDFSYLLNITESKANVKSSLINVSKLHLPRYNSSSDIWSHIMVI